MILFRLLSKEPLKILGGEAMARRFWARRPHKHRSLYAVNEHFFGGLVQIQRRQREQGNFSEVP